MNREQEIVLDDLKGVMSNAQGDAWMMQDLIDDWESIFPEDAADDRRALQDIALSLEEIADSISLIVNIIEARQ